MKKSLLNRIIIISRMLPMGIGMVLMLFAINTANGQVGYYQVTDLTGTHPYGCTNVTVTPTGEYGSIAACNTGPYTMELGGPHSSSGSYQWDFGPSGVSYVWINIYAIGVGEYISVAVNGVQVDFRNPIYAAGLSPYYEPCRPLAAGPSVDPSTGNLVPMPGGAGDAVSDATIKLNSSMFGGAINTVSVTCTELATGPFGDGIYASFYFSPIPPITAGAPTICTGSSVTFSDAATGGTWSSGSPTVATVVSPGTGTVTGLSAGTAIITYTGPTGCYVTTTVTVQNPTTCAPCHVFGTAGYTQIGASGILNMPLGPGNYYIANDVTIASWMGPTIFTDAVILLAPGVHINVGYASTLTLKGCHLFCCGDMWAGIVLGSNIYTTGTVTLGGDGTGRPTLIEDAVTGVDVEYPVTPYGGGNFVNCNGAIFNKCYTGINISNYYVYTGPLAYPFVIENTVFTSRDFSHYNVGSGYPYTWPGTTGTYGLKTSYAGASAYDEPFNINNPSACPACSTMAYAPVGCNVPGTPQAGIALTKVGFAAAHYYGVVVGVPNTIHTIFSPPNPEQNLFESLNFGIMATNADVMVHNSAFAHMKNASTPRPLPSDGGEGIYAVNTDGYKYGLAVEKSVTSAGFFPITSTNLFYNCKYGVYSNGYYSIKGDDATMVTNQSNAGGNTNSGFYGYDLQTWPFDNVEVSNNTIANVANGIRLEIATGVTATPSGLGQATIGRNHIQAIAPGATGGLGNHYVDNAIWVDNAISYTGSTYLPTGQVNTDNNTITDAYNGININGIGAQTATSNNNNITGIEYPTSGLMQYGIRHTSCVNDQTKRNTITGTDYTNDNWWGVLMENSNNHTVTCNEVTNVGRGFEFNATFMTSYWVGNTMTNNRKGFVLTGGQIGPQGGYHQPSDNQWIATGSFSWNGTGTIPTYETYTNGASPLSSLLWVKGGATNDPTDNSGQSTSPLNWYGSGSGSGNGLNLSSMPFWISPCLTLTVSGLNTQLLRQIARKGMGYTINIKEHNWMGQLTTYQAILKDPMLGITMPALHTFKTMGDNSRFALFTKIENNLAQGHIAIATTLLSSYSTDSLANTDTDAVTGVKMADDTAADNIINNYRSFYGLYIKYANSTLSTADSANIGTLAGLCPLVNGAVVYKARALYDIVFDTLRIFPNNCDSTDTMAARVAHYGDTTQTMGIASINDGSGQKYVLYPNPNNGNFTLQQIVPDREPVQVEVIDAIGRSVYKEKLQFSSATSRIKIGNVATGVYLLQLTDSKERTFRFKIMIE